MDRLGTHLHEACVCIDHGSAPDGVCPGMRGGHQMVLDPCSRTIYLFGGWDGTKDLSDFWKYDIVKSEWQLIAFNTEDQGGPSPRSCHKMVLDIDEQIILTLGRYVDQNSKTNDSLKSELHMYDIKRKRWTEISSDTYLDGGPRLVFDHQMAIDIQKKMMFVFGGRVIEKKGSELAEGSWLSGLYFYKMQTNSWKRVQPDVRATRLKDHSFKPRVGHCMIFHPEMLKWCSSSGPAVDLLDHEADKRLLYMFGGHYNKEPIKDMIAYDVDNESYQILADADAVPVGLTQRATVDLERNEIYVYFGVAKDREKPDDVLQNTIWIFDVNSSKWSVCPSRSPASLHPEPTARYAHQLVYDPVEKLHFLFGGNPARSTNVSKLRLDDFWKLQLLRPTAPELMRRVRNLLWRQKFMELCWSDPVVAVNFLQVNLAGGIDLNDPQEVEEFHQLPSYLFCNDIDTCGIRLGLKASSIHDKRTEVFSKLCDFFPDAMVPPRQNLMDLVQL